VAVTMRRKVIARLSVRHTPSIPARSLGILQTASAILLGADSLHTFDLRQRQLATACGLKVHPVTMPKPSTKCLWAAQPSKRGQRGRVHTVMGEPTTASDTHDIRNASLWKPSRRRRCQAWR
jgi:hypothetical protein